MKVSSICCSVVLLVPPAIHAQAALTITTEPNAIVWIDEIRRGTTDASGKLSLTKVSPGRHTVRVRANGFKETTVALASRPSHSCRKARYQRPTRPNCCFNRRRPRVKKRATMRLDKKPPISIAKRSNCGRHFPLRTSVSRACCSTSTSSKKRTQRSTPRDEQDLRIAEASAVEGRIYREEALIDEAIRSFRRAIREGGGVQPEAYVGLAQVLRRQRTVCTKP